MNSNEPRLEDEIKAVLARTLMLDKTVDDIEDELPLFEPEGHGLDSIDRLQLAVSVFEEFGIFVPPNDIGGRILYSVKSIADEIREQREQNE